MPPRSPHSVQPWADQGATPPSELSVKLPRRMVEFPPASGARPAPAPSLLQGARCPGLRPREAGGPSDAAVQGPANGCAGLQLSAPALVGPAQWRELWLA